MMVQAIEVHQITGAFTISQPMLESSYLQYGDHAQKLYDIYSTPVVGASGAIFGLLVAFGMLYPDLELMLLFVPVPNNPWVNSACMAASALAAWSVGDALASTEELDAPLVEVEPVAVFSRACRTLLMLDEVGGVESPKRASTPCNWVASELSCTISDAGALSRAETRDCELATGELTLVSVWSKSATPGLSEEETVPMGNLCSAYRQQPGFSIGFF